MARFGFCVLLLLHLFACGGGGGQASVDQRTVAVAAQSSTSTVSGTASKGPLSGATVEFYEVDNYGLVTGSPVATATTAADGSFTVTLPSPRNPLIAKTSGGIFRDESDQLGIRTISFSSAEGFEALLPVTESTIAITPFSAAILYRARNDTNGSDFLDVFDAARTIAANEWGLDVVTVPPADPVNPAGGASDASLNHALMLGAAANLANSAAIQLGLPAPNFTIIDALIRDMADGNLDGMDQSTPITLLVNSVTVSLPGNLHFVDALLRFRNNNFNAYESTVVFLENPTTLSGSVVGLSGSGLELELNGTSLAINESGSFVFPNFLVEGSSYSVTIASQPSSPSQTCTLLNGSGTAGTESVNNVIVVCGGGSPLYISNGTNWNDYVVADGTSPYDASDSPCTGSETGGYDACIHGGEKRVVYLSSASSCSGVSAFDSLSAFEWICDDAGGTVRVISSGLAEGVFLSDLIDWSGTPAWKSISVTTSGPGGTDTTSASVWWGNPVTVDNDGGSVNPPGTVYVVTVDAGADYVIAGDSVALVFEPGVMQSGADARLDIPHVISYIISADSRKFLWIEGAMDPYQEDAGMRWDGVNFSVVRNLTMTSSSNGGEYGMEISTGSANNAFSHITLNNIRNRAVDMQNASNDNRFYDLSINKNIANYGFYASSSPGVIIEKFHGEDIASDSIRLISSPGSRISQAQIYHGGSYGIYLSNSPNSTVVDAFLSNIDSDGLYLSSSANATLVNVTVAAADNYGINLSSSDNTRLVNSTAANNRSYSTYLSGSDFSVVTNAVAVNGNGYGIHFSSSHDLTAVNLASAHHNSYGVNTSGANNYFSGVLKVTDNRARSCSANSSAGLADKSCAPQNGSDATLTSFGFTLQNAFVGKVDMDESINASDSNGTSSFTSISDWGSFENKFRGWGVDGSIFPENDHDEACENSGETCRIWDWSLSSADNTIRGILPLPDGNDTVTHTWDVTSPTSQADCDAIVLGSEYNGGVCQSTFLRNASELMGDGIGDEDGLCESNEDCLFTPNIGHYQGHGDLQVIGNISSGGSLENIKLFEYTSNGRPAQIFQPIPSIKVVGFTDAELDECVESEAVDQGITFVNEVVMLDCRSESLFSVEGLDVFPNLVELDISFNSQLTDISPLLLLPGLDILNLDNDDNVPISQLASFTGLTELVVSRVDISDADITILGGLTNLEELDIAYGVFTGIGGLAPLVNLERLFLSNNLNLADISAVSNFTRLIELDVSSTGVTDLSVLSSLNDLVALYARDLPSITPAHISPLTGLQVLDVSENGLLDINFVAGMTQLQYLFTRTNSLTDLTPLTDLDQLLFVDLRNNTGVTNIASLFTLDLLFQVLLSGSTSIPCTQLDTLADTFPAAFIDEPYPCGGTILIADLITANEFTDTKLLGCVNGLFYPDVRRNTSLICEDADVADLAGIENLVYLETLDIGTNLLADDLSLLAGLTRLEYLDIQNNGLTNMTPLATLVNLETFISENNPFTDISALGNWTKLVALTLHDVEASTFPDLSGHTSLTFMEIFDSKFRDISALADLTAMEDLFLLGLPVTDISPLASMSNLQYLRLRGMPFPSISSLGLLSNLIELEISDGKLQTIGDLSGLVNLERLYLIDSHLKSIAGLETLAAASSLAVLNLQGNAFSDLSPLNTLTQVASLTLDYNLAISDLDPLLPHINTFISIRDGFNADCTDISTLETAIAGGIGNLVEPSSCRSPVAIAGLLAGISDANLQTCVTTATSAMTNTDELTGLDCSSLGITTVAGLQYFEYLENLNLANNSLTNFNDLGRFPLPALYSLTSLNLSNNSLVSGSPLEYLDLIESLDLSGNSIFTTTGIIGVVELEDLNLSGNSLPDTANFRFLTALETLDLSSNSTLTDISDLDENTLLEDVDLSGGAITNINSLLDLINPVTIDLTGNDNILCADLTTLDDALLAAYADVLFTQPGSCIP